MRDESFYTTILLRELGSDVQLLSTRSIPGGCINHGICLETSLGNFFLKWNEFAQSDLFEKECHGLDLLRKTGCFQVPEVIGLGELGSAHYLFQSFVEPNAPAPGFWENFGSSLAELHQCGSDRYGLDVPNHIGRLDQKNDWNGNWIDFFITNRLESQLGLARYNGAVDEEFVKKFHLLYPKLPGLLSDEPPSLLHGDLWSGNFMVGKSGSVCVFDPAVYYGNREIELAFTQLFGGFDRAFYSAYFDTWPVEPGFQDRAEIYNLYPLLVHLNLFGNSYLGSIETILRKFD